MLLVVIRYICLIFVLFRFREGFSFEAFLNFCLTSSFDWEQVAKGKGDGFKVAEFYLDSILEITQSLI